MSEPTGLRKLVDEVDAALQERRPGRRPLTDGDREAIAASVAAAPPMTEQQCRRIGRLLRGSKNWPGEPQPI